MHEANFELIEIPHVRQSGKNSADIRLVVDALDLCYTKSHVNTFVIISGDSDFSPLVSKLRENAKQVIGVGVKQSTSDLLIANCDEFIFYDDLVRESRRTADKRDAREAQPVAKRTPDEDKRRKEDLESRRSKAIEMAVETFDALVSERGDSGKIWASMLKEAIKRRKPDFSESYYGFRTFGNLLEEAQSRGLLEFGRDDKSGAYVYRSNSPALISPALASEPSAEPAAVAPLVAVEDAGGKQDTRRRGRGGRKPAAKNADLKTEAAALAPVNLVVEALAAVEPPLPVAQAEVVPPVAAAETGGQQDARRKGRGGRKPAAKKAEPQADAVAVSAEPPAPAAEPVATAAEKVEEKAEVAVRPVRKPATRSRRPRKPEVAPDSV